jgi:hypothetical protein
MDGLMMSPSRRRGATLIELLAALGLAGVVLGGALALLTTLRAYDARVAQRVVSEESAGVGHGRLRNVLQMMEGTESGRRPFSGDRAGARFDSRCRVAGGWLSRCGVDLQLVSDGDSTLVELRDEREPWTVVMTRRGHASLLYLERGPDVDRWREEWRSPVSRPVAVAIVAESDTLLLLGGGR